MSDHLDVYITIDVGPADSNLGYGHRAEGDWARTVLGTGMLHNVLRSLEDRYQKRIPATWFMRADRLIAQQFRDPLYVLRMFSTLRRNLEGDCHEIGWMPQVYEADQAAIFYDDLPRTYEQIKSLGLSLTSMRMGDCYHDNFTMKIVSELGIRVDSSALPGRQKSDRGWRMDWIGTPRCAYYPSLTDYRKPGSPHFEVIEVPFSVSFVMAPYDSVPLLRYVNPCMRKEYFAEGLQNLLPSARYLVMVLHPDEVVPKLAGTDHPLIAYSAEELEINLNKLVQSAIFLERPLSFRTLQEFRMTSATEFG
jgi:hypothetical protein